MSMKRSLAPAFTAALTLVVVAILSMTLGTYASYAKGPNDPATECLIDLQGSPDAFLKEITLSKTDTCKDGDACDADGKTDGSCTFKVRACVNVAGVSGCTPAALKSAKVNPKKLGISVTPNASTQVCGSYANIVVKLKGKAGKFKPSKKKTIIGLGKGTSKGVKDVDKVKVQCIPCDKASCVPPTTTTTTTTAVPPTLPPIPTCGNGTIDAAMGETCDPGVEPAANNGCPAGQFCNPTNCASCSTTCSELAFTLGPPTLDCGFPGQGASGSAPFSGVLQDGTSTNIPNGDLGLGCLYIGGGQATIVPPGPTPNGSTTVLGVTGCGGNALTLAGADTGNLRTCTVGPKTTKHCVNGHPGTDTHGACNSDVDCTPVCVNDSNPTAACAVSDPLCHCVDGAPGLAGKDAGTCSVSVGCIDAGGACNGSAANCGTCSGDASIACGCNLDCNGRCKQASNCGVTGANPILVCQPDAACIFGSPLPINNSGTSTCVLNVVADGVSGVADKAAGTANVTLPLKSWVYLTGVDQDNFAGGNACPICDNGHCNAGPRKGLACTTNSTLKTTHDCPPPPYLFLAPLDVSLSPLATEQVTKTSDGAGIFCPSQATGGAFGLPAARKIIENGAAASGGLTAEGQDSALASVFCIPATNNILIDNSANLPGPGAIGLGGKVRLQ